MARAGAGFLSSFRGVESIHFCGVKCIIGIPNGHKTETRLGYGASLRGILIAAAGIPLVAYREVRHVTEDFDFRAKNIARCYVVSPKSTAIRHGHRCRRVDLTDVRQERVFVIG
jgi:hypothetical protein